MISYRFHKAALSEAREAAEHYESMRRGVGQAFLSELDSAIKQLLVVPESGHVIRGSIRKKRFRKFPYYLCYSFEKSREIVIYAVTHQRRRPEYWLDRIPL